MENYQHFELDGGEDSIGDSTSPYKTRPYILAGFHGAPVEFCAEGDIVNSCGLGI